MGLQPPRDRRLVHVELAWPRHLRGLAARVLFLRLPAPHRLHVQLERAGDLRRTVSGRLRLFYPAIQFVIDHAPTSRLGDGVAVGDVGGVAASVCVGLP